MFRPRKCPPCPGRPSPDERTFFLEHTALAELTGLLKPNPFWEEMSAHPDYDAWWQERDLRRACYNVQPAVLVVGGTFDAEDCFGRNPLPGPEQAEPFDAVPSGRGPVGAWGVA
ncbi:MAG: CocE/NonD family hydrolase [Alistipes onderdonkii]